MNQYSMGRPWKGHSSPQISCVQCNPHSSKWYHNGLSWLVIITRLALSMDKNTILLEGVGMRVGLEMQPKCKCIWTCPALGWVWYLALRSHEWIFKILTFFIISGSSKLTWYPRHLDPPIHPQSEKKIYIYGKRYVITRYLAGWLIWHSPMYRAGNITRWPLPANWPLSCRRQWDRLNDLVGVFILAWQNRYWDRYLYSYLLSCP